MPSLKDVLLVPEKRPEIIADAEKVLDEEVQSKGGLSGLAVRAAYSMVKALKPGMIRHAVDDLLNDFADKLQPFMESHAQTPGVPLPDYFVQHSEAIADALLSITDGRAQKSKNGTVKKAYEKLRPTGKKNVVEAMPRVGRLVEKYTSS